MGVRPEYFTAASAASPYYRAARRMDEMVKPGPALQTEELPPGWLRQVWDVWEGWTPREWRPRLQGWKIHVSASLPDAEETLARTTRVCVEHGVAFKFLPSTAQLAFSNGKQNDRGQSGKFITIYPDDDDQLATLLAALETVLAGQEGPYILSDLRYGEAPVYVRHGGIMPLSYPDGVDEPVSAVVAGPEQVLVPDARQPRFQVPDGVDLPRCLDVAHERSRRSEPSRLREFKAITPLHFSNAGGVYRATLPDGTRRVLREARPHTGLDGRGRDAITRQHEEEAVLWDLSGVEGVQQIRGSFTAWEHRYLELDHVDGLTLSGWIVRNAPAQGAATPDDVAAYGRRCVAVAGRLVEIIERIHAAGWCVGDLHPGNVMVTDDDEVVVLDLEDATRLGEDRVVGFRVYEFCAPHGLSAEEADWYAVSRSVMMLFVTDWELEVIAPDYWAEALRRVATEHGPEAARLIEEVCSRFPATRHLLSPDETVGLWPQTPEPVSAIAGLDAGITWSRRFSPDGSYPGDPAGYGSEAFAHGRAGVVWARARLDLPIPDADVDALATAAAAWPRHGHPGLFDGLAGIALALADAGRPDAAVSAATAALASAAGRRRLDLHGGMAGVVLAGLEVARCSGDDELRATALAELDRLDRALPGHGPCWDALTHRRGLHHGLSGVALALLSAHLLTGDPHRLDRAIDLLRADVAACEVGPDGEAMVIDVDNGRALPYLDWGSAGVWTVVQVAERAARQQLLTDAQRATFVSAASAHFYIYPSLHRGRAGTLVALAGDGDGSAGAVEHQTDLLLRTLLHRDGMGFVAGEGFLRLSSDLATGAAGVMVALHAVGTGRPFDALPLGRGTANLLAALPVPTVPVLDLDAVGQVANHG